MSDFESSAHLPGPDKHIPGEGHHYMLTRPDMAEGALDEVHDSLIGGGYEVNGLTIYSPLGAYLEIVPIIPLTTKAEEVFVHNRLHEAGYAVRQLDEKAQTSSPDIAATA